MCARRRNKSKPVNVSIRKLASACRLYFSWGCTRITGTGWLLSKAHEKVRNKGMTSKQSSVQQNRTDVSYQYFMSVWFICWKSTLCSVIRVHSTHIQFFSITYFHISLDALLFIYICSIFACLYAHRVTRKKKKKQAGHCNVILQSRQTGQSTLDSAYRYPIYIYLLHVSFGYLNS